MIRRPSSGLGTLDVKLWTSSCYEESVADLARARRFQLGSSFHALLKMNMLSDRMRKLLKYGDLWLVVALFATILLLILPVAPVLLDMLLTVSIALSLLTLLVILYLRTPAEFTGFPTMLLFITLYRLALNVASTRLILLDGYAGHIIEAFGNFVVRGNYVVGLVVFLILVLINFIVITKGAGRIAEVAARFTLDALPGKQMAIDAELNADRKSVV